MKSAILLAAVLLVMCGAIMFPVRLAPAMRSASQWIVVDGDTIRSPAGVTYRIDGLDAPETYQAKCGQELDAGRRAKARLEQLIASGSVQVRELTKKRRGTGEIVARQDRYGRTLARVTVGGKDVADIMVREGAARPYAGGKRKGWCE